MLSKKTKSRLLSMWQIFNTQQCNMTAGRRRALHYLTSWQTCHFLLITKKSAGSTSQGLTFGMGQSEVSSVQPILKPVTCWWNLLMILVFWKRELTLVVFDSTDETPKRPDHFWWTRRTSVLGLQCKWYAYWLDVYYRLLMVG